MGPQSYARAGMVAGWFAGALLLGVVALPITGWPHWSSAHHVPLPNWILFVILEAGVGLVGGAPGAAVGWLIGGCIKHQTR